MIEEALKHFRKGHIIIFPTDTLYGIGCKLDDERAIHRLYKIRQTPRTKPSLILAANLTQAKKYGFFTYDAEKIAERFWPGPLTTIVPAKQAAPKLVQSNKGTIAIRIPDQAPLTDIIERLGVPILAPSANLHREKPPSRFSQIDKKLLDLVDYALDLKQLPSAKSMTKIQSTILDLSKKPYIIERLGAINAQDLNNIVEVQK